MMKPCSSCGAPSTLLCDGRIYRVGEVEFRVPLGGNYGLSDKTRSCDAPLCIACTKRVANVHIKASKAAGGCRWNSVDLCRECAKAQNKPVPYEAML